MRSVEVGFSVVLGGPEKSEKSLVESQRDSIGAPVATESLWGTSSERLLLCRKPAGHSTSGLPASAPGGSGDASGTRGVVHDALLDSLPPPFWEPGAALQC